MSLPHTSLNDLDYLICNIITQQLAHFDVAIKDILRGSKQTAIKCLECQVQYFSFQSI